MVFKLKENITGLKNDINSICKKTGRNVEDITIVAATKYASAEQINLVYGMGLKNFGENRADQLEEKYNIVEKGAIWHFIGHLQSRKIKIVVPKVELIHSIDKISTLSKVNDEAEKNRKIQKLLIEINISGEETKYGLRPGDLPDFLEKALDYRNVKIVGLMTMAPLTDDFGLIKNIFRRLRTLRDKSNKDSDSINLSELSMGMSNDYKIAIEEGATFIRVGSKIFK